MEWHLCSHRFSRGTKPRGEHVSPNNVAALPEKDDCKNRFYVHMRLAFFSKRGRIFLATSQWQSALSATYSGKALFLSSATHAQKAAANYGNAGI
jgi:hypothetical protein